VAAPGHEQAVGAHDAPRRRLQLTVEDFLAGHDPVLERALRLM
jgi:hypothetical protein